MRRSTKLNYTPRWWATAGPSPPSPRETSALLPGNDPTTMGTDWSSLPLTRAYRHSTPQRLRVQSHNAHPARISEPPSQQRRRTPGGCGHRGRHWVRCGCCSAQEQAYPLRGRRRLRPAHHRIAGPHRFTGIRRRRGYSAGGTPFSVSFLASRASRHHGTGAEDPSRRLRWRSCGPALRLDRDWKIHPIRAAAAVHSVQRSPHHHAPVGQPRREHRLPTGPGAGESLPIVLLPEFTTMAATGTGIPHAPGRTSPTLKHC